MKTVPACGLAASLEASEGSPRGLPSHGGSDSAREWCAGRLVEILQPEGHGIVGMIEAYMDESERPGGKFCVAGVGFAPAQARKLAKEWRRLFEGRVLHMRDLAHGRGDFEGLSPAETDRLLVEAVAIIRKRFSFAAAMSCNIADFNLIAPRQPGFRHCYGLLCLMVMRSFGDLARKNGPSERVSYIFESGHAFESDANRLLESFARHPARRVLAQYRNHAFVNKRDAVWLQAADLFAWEVAKFKDETFDRSVRPMRRSLRELLRGNQDRIIVRDYSAHALRHLRDVEPDLVNRGDLDV